MKRIICLALVLVMILTLVPMTAFAAEPTTLKIDRFNEYNSYDEVFAWSSDDESVTVETLYAGYPGGRTFEWYLKAWLVYDYETDVMATMTEENCNTEHWIVDKGNEELSPKHNKLYIFVTNLLRWFALVVRKLFKV
jgi:hypothetical protein